MPRPLLPLLYAVSCISLPASALLAARAGFQATALVLIGITLLVTLGGYIPLRRYLRRRR